jgi:hypothetical protein
MFPELVKEAVFESEEDDHRVVRLSHWCSFWSAEELLAFLHPCHEISFQRTSGKRIKRFTLSVAEADAFCAAWLQYRQDLEAWQNTQQDVL